ncbi:hypothetical protein PtA15_12A538 [Puccinia triticina]|nr:uncharacterized protein PtA15_12A538 [Puccinia triticina]WAQ90548.1 hypothetical protein PtA15_12A538 [Puccinia triticina]
MSLVPSPSRGIYTSPQNEQDKSRNQTHKSTQENQDRHSHRQEQDLTNHDFQLEFFKWIFKRIQEYKKSYPNRIDLFLYLSLKDPQGNLNQPSTDNRFKAQIDRISSLVREIRKLREGIFASGRRDSFAIVVYELSAELALESLDFAQLNTLLNHLIMDLYRNVPISEHRVRAESITIANEVEEHDVGKIINRQRRTKEEVLDRRLMFARVLLLLPIATRLDLSRFIEQFGQISRILSDENLPQDSTNHSASSNATVLGISTAHQPKLLELGKFFKFVLRKNYIQLNRKFIKPNLQKILKAHPQEEDSVTQWDDLLFLVFLNSIRLNLIWKVIQKSYYHLSLEDDLFIFNLLSLEFRNFDQLRCTSQDRSASNVNQLVDSWLLKLNIQRNSKGIVQLK